MYKVQRNIPKPPVQRAGAGQVRKYPVDTMDVGEMFFVPGGNMRHLGSHLSQQGKKLRRKFSLRHITMLETRHGWVPADAESEGVTQGVGVWRDE